MSRLSRLRFIDTRRTRGPVRRKVRSRGVPPALADHELFYTEEVRAAAAMVGKALSPGTLRLLRQDEQGFAASLFGVALRDVSLLYLDLTVTAEIVIPKLGSYFTVCMPTNGRVQCVAGDNEPMEANTVRALVTSPGTALRLRFDDDSPMVVVRIEEQPMVAHLTRLLGKRLAQPIEFEPEFDLTAEAAMRWNTAVQLLHAEVYYPGSLVQRGQGIGAIEELLMSSLLHLQPSNYHEELTRPAPSRTRRIINEVADYVEAHLGERITMEMISQNVHLSVRAIQQAFHDELGISPIAFIKERRLSRVRDELLDAMPSDGVTVTAVAERWGFHHLGSFSVEYRKRWGESPSETLRR
ncbi:AraC-type DNA-binding protein [Pseudonocardia thermophila]|uniref:AraC-type DNA-binding protein n=1 Tax=Pseudonocardia thermophila TaxID=1848 RepID=A0A1M6SMJ1_PSETH|nr:AraC family transcriptional regulator [Pseudonocardia thermophila]SHK45942.1 AraC-type DNA-binding protein [Pseudonocardia thermophila]